MGGNLINALKFFTSSIEIQLEISYEAENFNLFNAENMKEMKENIS